MVRISIIVAMADNRVIGKDNELPWHLPRDLKYFKAKTLGKPVLMGHNTFLSIGKPLPNRRNLVLTQDPNFQHEGVETFTTLEEALQALQEEEELMIIGGVMLYETMLPKADRLYLTLVHADVPGNRFFPEINWEEWKEISREDHAHDEQSLYDLSFVIFDRVGSYAD